MDSLTLFQNWGLSPAIENVHSSASFSRGLLLLLEPLPPLLSSSSSPSSVPPDPTTPLRLPLLSRPLVAPRLPLRLEAPLEPPRLP
eukprot:CAMPEP_0171964690 /NCGR_PEP_ID=MMETSP0993-20121228/182714_1 /TAXON_ID=483369 /ORGANISM="non described non described, Strain CCMP2098" /LENGTH=85 /DNA_ID=CAMNT_0012613589 /DNA_START=265 /DNA_END=519 /DNA_ORIENTATION=+